jgi:hypothetical protein
MMRICFIFVLFFLNASTAYSQNQQLLENQYRITCSAQAIATSPWLGPQCKSIRTTIDSLKANSTGDSADVDESTTSGGNNGETQDLSVGAVYRRNCVATTPRTPEQVQQCQYLEQNYLGGAASGVKKGSAGSNSSGASTRPSGAGPDCSHNYNPC